MSEESSGPLSPPPIAEVRVIVCIDGDDPGDQNQENPSQLRHHHRSSHSSRDDGEESVAGVRLQLMDNNDEAGDDGKSDREEECDIKPHSHGTTFGVTQDDDDEEVLFPGFVPKAFFYFTQRHWLRYPCLKIITWPYFERMSMAVILLNCITLGMYQPCNDEVCDTTRCKVLAGFDHFIFAFFATEMLIKMMAMGVFGKETYLDETWNRLDCFIVLAGSVEYAVDTENLSISAIRTIRVLRPLRAINRIPSMRILVMLLLDTLPMLGNVLLLCFFVFFIFGIIGVQLWAGVLRHRCFLDINSSIRIPDSISLPKYYNVPKSEYICSTPDSGGMLKCDNLPLYEYEGIRCNGTAQIYSNNTPSNGSCVNWNQYYTNCTALAMNPFMGAVSFDNIGFAWVVIFQVISLESWVNIMYFIQDAHSFWDWVYFVALIVIGSFFMINLCLVVIATQFSETKKRETERMMQERKRFQSCSTLASNSEPGGCYSELLKLLVHIWRRAKRKLLRTYHRTRGKNHQKINPEKCISLRKKRAKKKGLFADNLLMDIVADKQLSTQLSLQSEAETHPSHSEREEEDSDKDGDQSESETESYDESERAKRRFPSNICGIISKFQNGMKKIVEGNIFQRSILIAILLNTISMGIEHHNQPEKLTEVLEYSNVVFCVLFVTEMSCKIIAYGAFGYISDGFNVFDGFIVILSVVELAQGGASGLSVLRTFRLLRILKLVRFMPALRRQLVVMLRTMDNVATFFALLVLFMFIFSILGMNLFGCKFCRTAQGGGRYCERKNFDSLLWAIVTVFQVLTQEDWNTVLYNGMHFTSPWAALYFIALMTFGNYVLFNLLVAILVEGFSTEDEEKKREKQKEQEELEKQEKEKERLRLAENNNIGDIQKEQEKFTIAEHDLKNNKEKEKKMLSLPPPVSVTGSREDNIVPGITEPVTMDGPLNPPIITHTAATPMGTPMATPQGSPNENALKDGNKLTVSVNRTLNRSQLSVESDKTSVSLSYRGSPRPSPCLHRTSSRGSQRSSSWRLKNRRRGGDKTSLVVDSLSDSADDVEDDAFSSSQNSQSSAHSPVVLSPGANNQSSDCNGHPPLNNQRTLSPQNSIKGQRVLTPKNSIKSNCSWRSNNSVGSGRSICNSFELGRQNSFTSHRTINSLGSVASKDEHKQKNLFDQPHLKMVLDSAEGEPGDEDDPDAIDETDWNCSWCPEPKGCFLRRHEYSLYLLHPENPLRLLCHHLISRTWFDNSVLFFIALNCITLAMERPDIPPASTERMFLTYANYIFTFVFTIEMMLKVIAKGIIVGKHAYLKSGWNVMDGFLVIISLVDILISITADSSPRIFGILRVFRLLRTLRPLRVISRAPGLKLVVQTLLSSLRPIGNIVLICCTFFIIFGILGVQLFKGTFFYCKGPNIAHVENRTQCEEDGRNAWTNQKYNFDNLGQALMALFVLASKDGWVNIMYTGLDAVGVDQQPRENYNEWRLLFFISFLLLVGFFVLNMFVGVVVENFHKCRESQEKEERALRAAKRQGKLEKKRKKLQEPPYWSPYSKPRLIIHTVINSKYFDLAIAGVIGLNVVTMATEFYLMPEELEFALKIFNYFFTSVFILEAIMKIVALGFIRYIKDRWNQLDILIVILSIVGIVLEEMRTNVIPINPTIIRVMRVLRIARVLKLLKMAKGIRALLDTVIQALPQVGNLGLLFFLLFFIFAALGVELFGRLECSTDHVCVGLSEHAHFKNFGMAFLTLFRVATGDNWNGIMKDTLREEDCKHGDDCLTNCCVSPLIAPVYFVVFVLMAQFVLVNVVVAVLMKHLEETYKYKELDDEVEEELRQELANIQRNKQLQQEEIELKESHRMMDDDGGSGPCDVNEDSIDKLDDQATVDSLPKVITENSDDFSQTDRDDDTDCMLGSVSNQPPSFTFSVRPPSEEQSHHSEENAGSPAKIVITMETLSTPSNSILNPGLLSLPSLGPSCPSSPSLSESSLRITSPPLSPVHHSPRLLHLRSESSATRRPLVKQYSMDIDSEQHLQHGSSVPNVSAWEKFQEEPKVIKPKPSPHCSKSHPTLNMAKTDSLDSDPGRKTPQQRFKQRLLRSRSSGAKYSRFRDKYKHTKCGEDNPAAQPMIEWHLRQSKERLRSAHCGSAETSSDMDDSLISDWAEEERVCDEEVKKITGDRFEDDDDVKPTLVSYASSDLEDHPSASDSLSSNMLDSFSSSHDVSSSQSVQELRSHDDSLSHLYNPGIDNSSFELGEEVQTPKCESVCSVSGYSASNSNTPVASGSAMRNVSPALLARLTSPASTTHGLSPPITHHPSRSPPVRRHSQNLLSPPPSYPVTFPGMAAGGGLLSPQSPVANAANQRRLTPSPLHMCSTLSPSHSPHQHRLSIDNETIPAHHHLISSSPVPPSCMDSYSSLQIPSSSSLLLASPTTSVSPQLPSNIDESLHSSLSQETEDNLSIHILSHPLQPSPTPSTSCSVSFLPLPAFHEAGDSPIVRHRTLSNHQSADQDLPDNTRPL